MPIVGGVADARWTELSYQPDRLEAQGGPDAIRHGNSRSAKQLGSGQALKAALLKMEAALPSPLRAEVALFRQRLLLDSEPWAADEEPLPCLQPIRRAVWQDRCIDLVHLGYLDTPVRRCYAPYGLVAKTNRWYLVAAGESGMRVIRVSRIVEAIVTEEVFARPADFDLAAFWREWCAREKVLHPPFSARVRLSPSLLPYLPRIFGSQINDQVSRAKPDKHGWIAITLNFESFESARVRLLGFGRAVEVLEPVPLRQVVRDFAEQISAFYALLDRTGSRQ